MQLETLAQERFLEGLGRIRTKHDFESHHCVLRTDVEIELRNSYIESLDDQDPDEERWKLFIDQIFDEFCDYEPSFLSIAPFKSILAKAGEYSYLLYN